jgi:hypothetical protein
MKKEGSSNWPMSYFLDTLKQIKSTPKLKRFLELKKKHF